MTEYIYFGIIVMLMAFMDGFNFHFPHNKGWFSLTYGEGSNSWDIWHILKRSILLVIFIYMFGFEITKWIWWVNGIAFALIAWLLQYLIYDVLIKGVYDG